MGWLDTIFKIKMAFDTKINHFRDPLHHFQDYAFMFKVHFFNDLGPSFLITTFYFCQPLKRSRFFINFAKITYRYFASFLKIDRPFYQNQPSSPKTKINPTPFKKPRSKPQNLKVTTYTSPTPYSH